MLTKQRPCSGKRTETVVQGRIGPIRLQGARERKPDSGDYVRADHCIQYSRLKQAGVVVVERHGSNQVKGHFELQYTTLVG